MRFPFLLTFILASASPAFAQIVLQKTGNLPGQYIVEFVSVESSSARQIQQKKSKAIKDLRDQQKIRIRKLEQDMENSDLVLIRNLWVKQAVAISLSDEFLARLESLSYIQQVRPDSRYQTESLGIVTLSSGEIIQDNLNRVDIEALWAADYQGQGVVVAILDSGVDIQHKDLVSQWRGGSNSWFDPYGEQLAPKDITGHGTAVASIVLGGNTAGSFIGVAPKAQWIAARVFDNNDISTESAISESLQWILDPDGDASTDDFPDIVQNSWGLGNSEGSCANPFATELAAIDALGIDQVFAVGNSGGSGPSSFLTPAFDSHVISVGALQITDTLLFSSGRGPDICNTPTITVPAVVAPGQTIKTADLTFDGFDTDNTKNNTGTSFSSPHVSGALALLRSQFKFQDHLLYRTALFTTAVNLGAQNDFGRGLIQVSAASADLLVNQAASLRANEVSFSNTKYNFLESDSTARVSITRSGDISNPASISVQAQDGTATNAVDFTVVPTTVDFAVGESLKTVDLQLVNDDITESNESFNLVLSQNNNVNIGLISTIPVTIEDDDTKTNPSEEDEIGGASVGIVELMLLALFGLRRQLRK